jgi:single-stranded-DNA-specific exonuclease
LSENIQSVPSLEIDHELNFDMITENLIDELNSMQPFGPQNPEPVFYTKYIEIVFSKIIGNRHLKLIVKQKNSPSSPVHPAIWFNADQEFTSKKYVKEIAYRLRRNYWNNGHGIQLIIEDIR